MSNSLYQDEIPARVRLLVLGGGIHGVGLLHDMVSRGWQDVHLVEKGQLGCGTSSRSTKLIHGGLRYLQHLRDFWLVAESLKERRLLMELAGDLVKPLELLLPVLKGSGRPGFLINAGLFIYDFLAGKARIHKHRRLSAEEIRQRVPLLNQDLLRSVFSFWDSQTDDLALVRRVAASAAKWGGAITENCRATTIKPTEDGWQVTVHLADGRESTISALYVINALGPWSNHFLEASGLKPVYHGLNNEGIHLLLPDLGLKAGMLLQNPTDSRIFFVLPWQGKTLIGTTEALFKGEPDSLKIRKSSIEYLLNLCRQYFNKPIHEQDIVATFAGLRWLAVHQGQNLTATSRAYLLGEHRSNRGLLLTIYGGKLTTYRKLSEAIGNRITSHFGEFRPSRTADKTYWLPAGSTTSDDVAQRFLKGGIAYNPVE